MNGFDGPTLRSVRESHGVPLRRVARQAGMSHGHLSKVERGEPGRPVTPTVLYAYEKATGVKLTGMAGHDRGDGRWRRGHLSDARRRTVNAKIAAVAVGGPLGEQVDRILDGTGRAVYPERVEVPDVVQIEQAAGLCTGLDLQLGGEVCHEMARALLRWAVGQLEAEATPPVRLRLYAAVGALAQRAGWAAFDADSHDVARSLLTIGVFAAERADDADLRAHVLADLAAQHNYLGYPDDCLQVARLGEVDERVGAAVRMVIHGVKARAYGLRGEADMCWRHLHLAGQAQVRALDEAEEGVEGWRATVATPARLLATTGHALAALARRTDDPPVREEAATRLAEAIDRYDPARDARAIALCATRLAAVWLDLGEVGQAEKCTRQALDLTTGIRSSRLDDYLASLREAAAAVPDGPAAHLVEMIDSSPEG